MVVAVGIFSLTDALKAKMIQLTLEEDELVFAKVPRKAAEEDELVSDAMHI